MKMYALQQLSYNSHAYLCITVQQIFFSPWNITITHAACVVRSIHFIFSEVMLSFLTKLGIMNGRKSREYFGDVWKLLTVVSYMYFSSLKGSCNTHLASVDTNNILVSVYWGRFLWSHKIYYISKIIVIIYS